MKAREIFILLSILILGIVAAIYPFWNNVLWFMVVLGPLILVGYFDIFQRKHSIRRNFPVIGNLRFILESIRPEIMQYFVENDTDGRPINRLDRSLIYQRSKKVNDTTPFGTQLNTYDVGYEWIDHSIYARNRKEIDHDPRVLIGGADCLQPYAASIMNISAMSFGSLSKNAVLAMNKGAKMGGFAQNTGEGAISPYHLQYGGDLIWQIGTGYFGCRDKEGNFNPVTFKENANTPSVKMIELKISQGAKPGHGGILPASKNTEEIAAIRHVEPHTTVHSPNTHSAFKNATELMYFIKQMRELSNGKPIGFKMCIGKQSEFIDICEAMVETGIKPDFITIDGGEGGTGAAPVEFSNAIGIPLRDGLAFAVNTLRGYDLRKDISIVASGKVFSSFDIARLIAIGADTVACARAMMLATGCIQALQCHKNTCPVGVATQDKRLMKGLDVENKAQRVANFHSQSVYSFIELMAASGVVTPKELKRVHINRRVEMDKVKKYNEIYPLTEVGSLLKENQLHHV
ncbi:FMN-binding glutamate synthase family protein [Brumimicrobium salinarum]|uniref:FMN-binding glutamate synthase family protein n=1 Tax=Brumimicrobium salinarum TaxID=2058658 RepID=A0A2I0R019_9FLAO|nr:FMN-binding glutamate synthase family protein [Brumimicrobium salinarum]PKR79917.1 FMN-binding glutamate synthase family protein [Brumimicrobium salinarum]